MKSTVDKLDGLNRKLQVEIPVEKVQNAFERAYKNIQKNVEIKGFRKGKAPIATIRSLYQDRVRDDVLNDLVSMSYRDALEEHSLDPIGYPNINIEQFDSEKSFSFSAEFEIRPDVELKKYQGLEVKKERWQLNEEQVEKILTNIRENQASYVPVLEDRSLALGDFADLDFDGFVDGQPLEGGSAKGHRLEIGAKQFIEGFEDGLLGMKPGDHRELNLNFPENYHAHLAGKSVLFKVKLNNILRKELPELSDELATKSGPFANLEELKEAIRKDMQENEEKRIRDELKNRLLKTLVEANPVEPPKSLLTQQKQMIIDDTKKRMTEQGMTEEQFVEYQVKWDKDFEETASFMVQSTFLVDAIAEKESLHAKPSDVEQKIADYAKQTGIDLARIEEFYNEGERRSRLAFQITEEKVVNFLLDKATIEEVDPDKIKD